MKKYLFILSILILPLFLSCQDREKIVDKESIYANDVRLFQKTDAWELAKAVVDENIGLIERILEQDTIDINFQEQKYGQTLLMFSIELDKFSSFLKLIEFNADVNIHNTYDSSSAIHLSCKYNPIYEDNTKYLKILIDRGANVNDQSNAKQYNTPLIIASRIMNKHHKSIPLVKLLVQYGADVNYINSYNYSALKASLVSNNFDVSLYLIENGADYNIPLYKQDRLRDSSRYIMDILANKFLYLEWNSYKNKMKLVKFLEKKGLKYVRNQNFPDYLEDTFKKKYPDSWKEYLEVY
ncbi:MAG: ankyrin repeat domain-containing protein [Chlorobiota bacterium]